MPADASQTPQHVRQVTAKNASIRMQFVDDDELQILE
jgi:hypothetical protein